MLTSIGHSLQDASKNYERVTPRLQLAMFFSRHRCVASFKKNCLVTWPWLEGIRFFVPHS